MYLLSQTTSIDTKLNETPSIYIDMGIIYVYLNIRLFVRYFKV